MSGVGGMIDRLGVRRMMLGVAASFGLALLACSRIAGLITLTLAFLVLRFLGHGSLIASGHGDLPVGGQVSPC